MRILEINFRIKSLKDMDAIVNPKVRDSLKTQSNT